MAERLTLDDILESYKANAYGCCVINEQKFGGHTIETPKPHKITYATPGIKTAKGKIIYRPTIETGDQVVSYAGASLPYGSTHDTKDPEILKKISNFEILLEKPNLRFSPIPKEKMLKFIGKEEGESEEEYQVRIDHLVSQNQKICEVLRIISVGFQKLTEELSKRDPKQLGCYFRNYKHALKYIGKPWVPPSDAAGDYFSPMLVMTKDEKTGELIPREEPVYRIKFEEDKSNYGPIVRSRWVDRRKKYESFIKDINKYLDGEADDLLKLPTGEDLNITNLSKAIPPKSIIRGSFAIENLVSIGNMDSAALHCYIQSLYVSPNQNGVAGFDPDEGIMGNKSHKEDTARTDHVNEAINSISFGEEFD